MIKMTNLKAVNIVNVSGGCMKKTFEQGKQAYFAGVHLEEVFYDLDLTQDMEWVLGWITGSNEALHQEQVRQMAFLDKNKRRLDKCEQNLLALELENKTLKEALRVSKISQMAVVH